MWRDTRDIDEFNDFSVEIEKAIRASQVVVTCITPSVENAEKSFVRREIIYADAKDKPIIPLIFPKATPITLINHLTWVPFFHTERKHDLDFDGGLSRLLERLNKGEVAVARPSNDPFKAYLIALQDYIVGYLEKAILRDTEIPLDTTETEGAVPEQAPPVPQIDAGFYEADGLPEPKPIGSSKNPPGHRYESFAAAFEHHNGRLLLLGEPGAGKTITLMAHAREAVAARLGDAAQPLPVLKIAATWPANPPAPLATWAAGNLPALIPQIEAGNALLLLDGLDELGGEREGAGGEKYDPRQRFIDAVAALNDRSRVLVTCRVKDYAAIGHKLPLDGAITLQPLSDAQLAEYLADHPTIYAAIQADEQLRELARTPLLLSLIAFAWEDLDDRLKQRDDLQTGDVRDAIFLAYCKQVYEREERRQQRLTGDRAAPLPFTLDEILAILGELAMWNATGNRLGKDAFDDEDWKPEDNVLSPYDFRCVIADADRRAAFIDMATRLSLLLPTGEADHRFAHLLLRDTLAFTFALPRLRDEVWIKETPLSHSSPARALVRIGDPRAVEPLIAALSDAEWRVRRVAAWALGRIGDARAVQPLIAALSDAEARVRRYAAWALGKIGDARAVEPLTAALRDAKADVRSAAADALGVIGDARAVEPLTAALRDAERQVRSEAAEALGKLGDARAVEPLIATLRDADHDVRSAASDALGQIGEPAVEPLIATLRDADHDVRSAAADALGQIGNPRAVAALIAALRCPDWWRQSDAVRALGQIGDPRAVEPLMALLDDVVEFWPSGPRICDFAYAALRKIGTAEALAACEAWVAAGNEPRAVWF